MRVVDGEPVEEPADDDWERLEELLEKLDSLRDTRYALFAVRPSGFDTFMRLRFVFDRRELPLGYEPVPQAKAVRLNQTTTQQP